MRLADYGSGVGGRSNRVIPLLQTDNIETGIMKRYINSSLLVTLLYCFYPDTLRLFEFYVYDVAADKLVTSSTSFGWGKGRNVTSTG